MLKKCLVCGIEKQLSDFYNKSYKCKCCVKAYYQKNKDKIKDKQAKYREENKEKNKSYYQKNKDKIKDRNAKHRKENKEKRKLYYDKNKGKDKGKLYYQKNKDKIKDRNAKHRKENKEKLNLNRKKYYDSDPQRRFKQNLRVMISQGFRLYSKNGKTKSCKEYGIDFESIYSHLGPKPDSDYHLDHIIPLSSFDLDNNIHVKLAHLPCNLRWAKAEENLSKNNSIQLHLIGCRLSLLLIASEIGIELKPLLDN